MKQKALHNPDKTVALLGNPNVGKSTVFNSLTGLNQHTGNWPGKTVESAYGIYTYRQKKFALIDLPGTYSLVPHSAEEEVSRDYILCENPDAVIVVCDATCLERNLNLLLQTMEISPRVVLCLNLMDEAKRKGVYIDTKALSRRLGIPVIPTTARKKQGLTELKEQVDKICCGNGTVKVPGSLRDILDQKGYSGATCGDAAVTDLYREAEEICKETVRFQGVPPYEKGLTADRFLTGKWTGIPTMLILLLFVLWLTIFGANYPSQLLSRLLFSLEEPLYSLLSALSLPDFLIKPLVFGMYRVLAWVVAVMLPPMAIFFPLFSLLEDLGYLPRVAFNLDGCFQKCNACGKQALTMCMGFGCNAVGVTGCRIIDSPRERLIAILTNCFVPCNGRFPTLISIITMFFIVGSGGALSSFLSALCLTLVILAGIGMTFLCSKILSKTLLSGLPSSFTMELPPYRPPQVGKILVRSLLDRTLFVLGRAVSVAAPAGLVLYLLANVTLGGASLLSHLAVLLDPFARLFGMDGIILTAFILGFPANEIVLPIAVMAYLSQGTLTELGDITALRQILVDNGWTQLTALCTMTFSLMHWPCSTTLLSIRKETGSTKWTVLGFLIPTLAGFTLCFLIANGYRLLSLML